MSPAAESETTQLKVLKALAHPVRLKILGVLSYRQISPAEFARENGIDVSNAAYHFRKLRQMGCVKVIDTRPARGSTEHFYDGTRPVVFDDDVWKDMPDMLHQVLSHTVLEDLLGRINAAFVAGTFDARDDRHFTWTPMVLDEEGWTDAMSILKSTFERLLDVKGEASERMASSGEKGIPATVALIGFESPKAEKK